MYTLVYLFRTHMDGVPFTLLLCRGAKETSSKYFCVTSSPFCSPHFCSEQLIIFMHLVPSPCEMKLDICGSYGACCCITLNVDIAVSFVLYQSSKWMGKSSYRVTCNESTWTLHSMVTYWSLTVVGPSRHYHSSSSSTSAPAAIHSFTSSGMVHHRRSTPWRVPTSKGAGGSVTSMIHSSSQQMYYCRTCMIGCAGPQVSDCIV